MLSGIVLIGVGVAAGAAPAAAASYPDVAGRVVPFGDAAYLGTPGTGVNKPIVAMAATPTGHGYWEVASDGGIFNYGDAKFYGSTGGVTLNKPIVAMAPTPTGHGYWLVASDGGIFNYGDAHFYGSTGGVTLSQPVVGMARSRDGKGYWLASADGGIFNYGDAAFHGSMGGATLSSPVTQIVSTTDGGGYWLLPAQTSPAVVSQTLQEGDTGQAVLELQKELLALGYWVGTPDGEYGDATVQAVYALQKAAGISPDGVAGPQTEQALAQGVVPHPQSTSGYVIEIDLALDVIMFVNNGHLEYTINTSTGGGYTYTENGQTDVAITPTGHFSTFRTVDGTVTDSLGTLYRPRFFYEGYAIHGDSEVPPYPVSHGCARVSNEAIDWIWANNLDPVGATVWVY